MVHSRHQLFIGASFGMMTMCLMVVNGRADERKETEVMKDAGEVKSRTVNLAISVSN